MEGLLWGVGAVLIGVVGVSVFTVLRLKSAEQWILEAKEQAPAKKIASMEAFISTIRKEFTSLLEENDGKHDRWMREQASLRTYLYRRLGKEDKSESLPSDAIPDRISAAEAAQLGAPNGPAPEEDERTTLRRKIKAAYYAARGQPT